MELCKPGWPQTHIHPLITVSQVTGLKACVTTPGLLRFLKLVLGVDSSHWSWNCSWAKTDLELLIPPAYTSRVLSSQAWSLPGHWSSLLTKLTFWKIKICVCGLQKPEECIRSLGAGGTGVCEQPDLGAMNQLRSSRKETISSAPSLSGWGCSSVFLPGVWVPRFDPQHLGGEGYSHRTLKNHRVLAHSSRFAWFSQGYHFHISPGARAWKRKGMPKRVTKLFTLYGLSMVTKQVPSAVLGMEAEREQGSASCNSLMNSC